ncbi:type II secretion system F family protein [Nocardioides panacis]|uniref:Type II secretion system F family protein n=1 Tax=Nocardioides panacis TaxID=2849501 RepID=A0A975SXW3_9ACTN|nr:type II secretion system F family protein [Nocardioides panacis]QWZ07440.1 type II secretion system F family protein [Nocardioides panacis]
MRVVAVLAAAAAVALVWPVRGRAPRPPGGSSRGPAVAPVLVVAAAGAGAGLLVLADGTRLALGLVSLGALGGAGLLVRRGRAARAATVRQAVVVDVCEALAGELRAGQPPAAGLEHCRELWPDLEPVVAAARLGADVPAALRRLAAVRGAEGLAEVASAWQVSERSGAGLAAALGQVALTARERQGTRRLVQGELASAQATARLVAVLPVASLAMSTGVGGDPWHFLLGTPVGVGCLGLGALFALAGLLWIDRIAATVLRA